MTIDTAVRGINATTKFDHSRSRLRVNVGTFFIRLGIERTDLQIRDHGQADPRESEGPEKTEEEWDQTFHKCTSDPSASTGFKNVGTVEVRPRPNSIKPK